METIEVEKGLGKVASCLYSIYLFEEASDANRGEAKLLCGTYTAKAAWYYNEVVQCGGKRGDYLIIEMTVCGNLLSISEVKAYPR